jgi:hypothetical protein
VDGEGELCCIKFSLLELLEAIEPHAAHVLGEWFRGA